MSDRLTTGKVELNGAKVNVYSYTRISVDDILAHKVRETLFYLVTKKRWASTSTSKEIKTALTEVRLDG